MKKFLIIFFSVLALTSLGWLVGGNRIEQWLADREKNNLPPAEQLTNTTINENTNSTANVNEAVVELPAEKNLAVPFTSQAPHANWDEDHGEFCEEASVLMAGRYFARRGILSADDAEAALQSIKRWELDNLGWYFDTTAAETASIIRGLYDLTVTELEDPTITDIKSAIAAGKLVLVPAAGRELGNPNFTAPGPIYHFFVIRGYTADGKFITNDPGTRKGEQYVYDQQVVMDAISDWVPKEPRTVPRSGDVAGGRKVVLIVSPAE